ncbi:hypothetical protein TNCV_2975161 [Trichonephila clavipes]|nr:hypothetical protein TNCV_2975161 [Trichonephila clavipes]
MLMMTRQQSGKASGSILPKSHVRWLGESGQWPRLSPGSSEQGPQWPRFLMAFQDFSFWVTAIHLSMHVTFANACGYNALCSFEDFRLRRLGFLLGVLVGFLITGDPNRT